MLKESEVEGVAPGSPKGARRATGGAPGEVTEVKRWSAGRKKEVVLRLLRNESVDDISREVSVPIYKLEQWQSPATSSTTSSSAAPQAPININFSVRAMDARSFQSAMVQNKAVVVGIVNQALNMRGRHGITA